ncbi:hypothetical protein KV100_10030 [Mumia sp. zg.B21]|uniref:hypothetical protein n=1 Tax=Mumia sp. zg.B21 TaxID=2855447 RepID=UPI001C6F05D4|nr:hypothetical protein [Mumia sp. zg.B21]MBW9209998.1 hypothetical protein [Mumia sp. zg.B21]
MVLGLWFLAAGVLVAPLIVLWLLALIDALRTPTAQWEQSGQSQVTYIVLMVLLGPIGSLLYLGIARPRLRRAESASVVGALSAPHRAG